jgi:hypothetical protein
LKSVSDFLLLLFLLLEYDKEIIFYILINKYMDSKRKNSDGNYSI